MSGASPLTARVDFAEVYSKCALAFTSGSSGGACWIGAAVLPLFASPGLTVCAKLPKTTEKPEIGGE